MPDLYPDHLIPRPSYRLLVAADVHAGWLLRRTPDPVAFLDVQRAANGRPYLRTDQIASPPQRLPEGLSVSLLGQFRLADAAWVPATDAAKAYLRAYWQPSQIVVSPAVTDMQATPLDQWDAYALSVAEVEGYELATTRGTFIVHLLHAPTGWNYWHCELRFKHTIDGWADSPGTYSANQLRKVGEAIRAAFQEAGLAQPLSIVGSPDSWPPLLFDTAVSA